MIDPKRAVGVLRELAPNAVLASSNIAIDGDCEAALLLGALAIEVMEERLALEEAARTTGAELPTGFVAAYDAYLAARAKP